MGTAQVVTRRTIFDLRKARDRAHVLEGLTVALANLDQLIELIKASGSPAEARAGLVARDWAPEGAPAAGRPEAAGASAAAHVAAQETEQAAPPPPAFEELASDWWTYFEPAEALDTQTRAQRVSEARTLLQRYRQDLNRAADATQTKLIDKIVAELKRFEQLKSAPAPLGKPATPAAETYTLDEALQRHASWRGLNQEVTAESEESSWQSVIVAEERKQQ